LKDHPTWFVLDDLRRGTDELVKSIEELQQQQAAVSTSAAVGGVTAVIAGSSKKGSGGGGGQRKFVHRIGYSGSGAGGYYLITLADQANLIVSDNNSGNVVVALSSASILGGNFMCWILNLGSYPVVITPPVIPNQQYVNLRTSWNLNQDEGGVLFCDGYNFYLV
jgi:hypothetical protein